MNKKIALLSSFFVLSILATGVIIVSDGSDATESSTVTVFTDVNDGTVTMVGTGSTIKTAVSNAVTSSGYSIEINANGTIKTFNGQANTDECKWVVYQWRPPTGWTIVLLNSTGNANFTSSTSYYIFYADVTTSEGTTTYSSPSYEPEATAYFFIKFSEDYNANSYITSTLTEEQRIEGFWISGTGSNAAWAFKNACETYGFELNMSNGVKGTTVDYDYIGWLYSFFGLEDVNIGNGIYRYWSQFYWDSSTSSWIFGETFGHYDPAVVTYFALIRQTTTESNVSTNLGVYPSDVPSTCINGYCTVKFVDGDNKTISTQKVTYLGSATAPSTATKTSSNNIGYTFTGWNGSFDQVIENLTIYATFSEYAVESVKGVTLDETSYILDVDGKLSLNATITPTDATNKNVTWSSSKTSVATVDSNGVVTAVSAGTAIITVTTSDGGYTATCTVTLSDSTIDVTGITLSSSSSTIKVGNSTYLYATITPSDATNKGVTWSSSDTSVATVDSAGKVTAISIGTATITATSSDGGYKATCTFTVASSTIDVTGITLNVSSHTMDIGDSITLLSTIYPSNASNTSVTWSSSDVSVAKVDQNGLITAVSAGNATITVTTEDGSYTSNCTITVNEATLSLTISSSLLIYEGNSFKLTATCEPSSMIVTWSSSDSSIASVTADGTIHALSSGTTKVTASCDGIKVECIITVIGSGDATAVTAYASYDGAYSITITSETIGDLTDGSGLVISSEIGDLLLSKDVMSHLSVLDGDITITISQVDVDDLTDAQKESVGNGLVISFTAKAGNTNISDLEGTVTVTVPYTLKSGEDPDNIKVYYLNDSGTMESVWSTYDSVNSTVSFKTDHFSYYVLSYEMPSPSGNDNTLIVLLAASIIVIVILIAGFIIIKKKRGAA